MIQINIATAMCRWSIHLAVLATALLVPFAALAQGRDARDSSDHPVLSRYPGSRIQAYDQVEFDSYPLALGVEDHAPSNVTRLEGKVTKIRYVNPEGRSALEIYKNYEEALLDAGFEVLWSCEAAACGRTMNWNGLNGLTASGGPRDIRYLTVRGSVDDRVVTVAMAVNRTGTTVHVIETQPMESGLVPASAAELAAGIDRDGHVSVYDILFDVGKSEVKPESRPALEEVARLLAERPELKLLVVGHTDSTGSLDANMKLSADRAAAVARELVAKYGVAVERLEAHGVGPLAPTATNRTEEGRAENRRVDLVER